MILKRLVFARFALSCALVSFAVGLEADESLRLVPTTPSVVTLPDSSRYTGEMHGGLFNGQGTLVWRNGSRYEGKFKNGVMEGSGKLIMANGDVYESQFVNGLPDGQGRVLLHSGDSYSGSFKAGLLNGKGTFRSSDRTVYQGDFKQDDFSGKGTIQWANGNYYDGDIVNWHMTGTGILTDSTGNRYQGQFKDGLYQGDGEFHASNGGFFKGQFDRGNLIGKGEIHFVNGDIYSGEITNWRPEGIGSLQKKIDGTYHGEFHNGHYEGMGELDFVNGNRYVGQFKNGYFSGKGTFYFKEPNNGRTKISGMWDSGNLIPIIDKNAQMAATLLAEEVLSGQNVLVDEDLEKIKPGTPGVPDMYFVAFGGDAKQPVFMKESRYTKQLFDDHYGTKGRSIALYNGGDAQVPLATTANLKRTLLGIAKKMNRDEDVLFLYLTSHGSKDHVLTLDMPGLFLPGLSADQLAEIVHSTGIKWKVIVVSSCFSGGFVDTLKDDYSLIISAARRDRVSFGCSDDAEFTYFGRAFFADALPKSSSFKQAFDLAKIEVAKWEAIDHFEPSIPQLFSTAAIEHQLAKWQRAMQCQNLSEGMNNPHVTGSQSPLANNSCH